jgi:hypothetical protein
MIGAVLLSTGCHSKTAATPENFTQALNASFIAHPECLMPDAPRFPFVTTDPKMTKQMDALTAAQLLTVKREAAIETSRYTVTQAGARAAPRFCYGHRDVTAIESFTPPKVTNGFPETQVTYQYEIKDVPVWAKAEQVRAAFPEMERATSGVSTGKATLAKTLAGWSVPD